MKVIKAIKVSRVSRVTTVIRVIRFILPFSPVQSARKFSAVFGVTLLKSSNKIRPTIKEIVRKCKYVQVSA